MAATAKAIRSSALLAARPAVVSVRGVLRNVACSSVCRGQADEDLTMGERAAKRTNDTLQKIGGMYVSQNFGYSKKYAESYERVFGTKSRTTEREDDDPSGCSPGSEQVASTDGFATIDVTFARPGPLGLEISWTVPPTVTGVSTGGVAEGAGVQVGQRLLQIGGLDATVPLPQLAADEVMQQRPLHVRLSRNAVETRPQENHSNETSNLSLAHAIGVQGVAKVPAALSSDTAASLLSFAMAERKRCLAEVAENPSAAANYFSNVQTPRALVEGSPVTRWDMRLPLVPVVHAALRELLGSHTRGNRTHSLGTAFEAVAGGSRAELWELGVVVSEPGAGAQRIHFDAPCRCLFTTFVALQDISHDMGPTFFLLGTHSELVHSRFEKTPDDIIKQAKAASALMSAGDAVVYDSRILHAGGANRSNQTRALLYVTFRDPSSDPTALGVDQHSIRAELAGQFSLSSFQKV